MSRRCWVFVLLVFVVVPSNASPPKCDQRERSIANLDLAEESLNRAKQLYPDCKEESSNSSECSKKDKSLGLIDAALNLVSTAKKNIPICPDVTTEEPPTTTLEPTTEGYRPMDCQDLQDDGHVISGVYTVWPQGGKSAVRVQCDMDTDGGGWTVIQRRGNFWKQEDFYRDWQDYKNGFGSLDRDFWIGNDHIFALTNQGNYSLRLDMTGELATSAFALFREFRIEDENVNYKLHVKGYNGTAGANLGLSDGEMFSTKDRINNKDKRACALERHAGFWFNNSCAHININGVYKPEGSGWSHMHYYGFNDGNGLSSIEMKIKRM